MSRLQALMTFYDQPEIDQITAFYINAGMDIKSMSTDGLLKLFLTRPSTSIIEEMHLTWWVKEVGDELSLRPDTPGLLRTWKRVIRFHHHERQRRTSSVVMAG